MTFIEIYSVNFSTLQPCLLVSQIILSLIFYLILTCPFQRVRFVFLFSLWNINLRILLSNDNKRITNNFFRDPFVKRNNMEWHYFNAFAENTSFHSENKRKPYCFLKTSFIIFVNFGGVP